MNKPEASSPTKKRKGRNDDLQKEIREIWFDKEDGVMTHIEWLEDNASADPEAKKKKAKIDSTSKKTTANQKVPEVNFDDVMRVLENKPKDNKHLKSHERLRNIFTSVLKCVDTLGRKVADGASIAFAPAPACFSALSFVIQFWIKYENMFENIAELLERCYTFLSRFHSYKNNMTLPLQLVACKLLHHIVKVCRYSVEIWTSKRKAWSALLKDGFLGESDVKDLMAKMEQLVHDELALLVAESFSHLIEIGKTIAGEEAQRKGVADAQAWKRAISESLWMGEEGNEPKPVWKNAKREIEKTLIQGTGQWIQDNQQFRAWVKTQDTPSSPASSNSVLVLKGKGNSGKTRLVANIINQFEVSTPRPVVGYFFHQRDSKRPLSRNKLRSTISRSLLWQFATSRDALTRSMARASAKMGYNPDYIDIWRQLFLDLDPAEMLKSNYYIIIDGLDNDIGSVIPLIYEITRLGRVRVLLTAKDDVVTSFSNKQAFPFSTVELLGNHNSNLADIGKFISEGLDSMDALKDDGSTSVKHWRKRIRDELEKRTKGDYIWISTILSSLARADRATEFSDVLKNIQVTRAEQIQEEIVRLNKDLSDANIEDLNRIILWVTAAQELPTVGEMNAVLFLEFGPGSFIPLQQRLGPLLELNNAGRVNFKSPEIKNIIPPPKPTLGHNDGAKFGAGDTAKSSANTETVHRFLEYVCPRREYDKASLETFLWENSTPSKSSGIHYDEANSHMCVALICLKFLTSKKNKATEELRTYAGTHLCYHLKKTKLPQDDQTTQAANVDHTLIMQAVALLVKLFTDNDSIDSLFWTRAEHMSQHLWSKGEGEWLKRNRRRWLYTSEGVNELVRWFTNPVVAEEMKDMKNITKDQKDLVRDFIQKKDHRHKILLEPVAKRLAHHLLFEDIFTSREECTAVYFLHGYVSRLSLKTDTKKMTPCYQDRADMLLEEMLRIEEWAIPIFGPSKVAKSPSWHIQIATTIRSMCANDDEVKTGKEQKARIKKVEELDPENLMASHLVVSRLRDYVPDEDPEATKLKRKNAITVLEDAVKVIERINTAQLGWFDSISRSILATSIYLELGDLYWDDGDPSLAPASYRKSLKYSSTRYSNYLVILERYQEKEKWSEVIDFITTLNEQANPEHLARYLDRFIHEFLAVGIFQRIASKAAEKTGTESWEVIETPFDLAIKEARKSPADLFHAHKAYISIVQRSSNKEAMQDSVIHHCKEALACGVLQAESGSGVLYHDIFAIVDTLAHIYLNKAVALLEEAHKKMGKPAGQKSTAGTASPPETPRKTNEALGGSKLMPEVKRLLDDATVYALEMKSMIQDTDVWMNTGVYCCLAWYQLKLGDPAAAQKAVEEVMAAALGLLSDDDPSNDWFAFLHLGRVLNTIQDRKNARAAWEMLTILQPDTDELLFSCYGCSERFAISQGDRICMDCCGQICLHSKCHDTLPYASTLEKVKTGGCYKHHHFITISTDENQAKAAKHGKIRIDTEEITLEVWKDRLMKQYVLEGVDVGVKGQSPAYIRKRTESIPERDESPTRGPRGEETNSGNPEFRPKGEGTHKSGTEHNSPMPSRRGPPTPRRGPLTPRRGPLTPRRRGPETSESKQRKWASTFGPGTSGS